MSRSGGPDDGKREAYINMLANSDPERPSSDQEKAKDSVLQRLINVLVALLITTASLALCLFIVWLKAADWDATARPVPGRREQAEEPKEPPQKADIPALIDKLQEIGEGGVGYMPTRTGSGFLPLGTGEPGAMLLGQRPPTSSDTLRELVAHGVASIPHLIAHLDDKRTTQITIEHKGGFGGMFFEDEYDYNRRTIGEPPEGVNRRSRGGGDDPDGHTVTVGDLCFVALGQIVNRHFNAVRYQPTACIMINSPTHSVPLLNAAKKEWGSLTPAEHKQSLVRDFLEPDSEDRRTGACLRLGYYYPDSLEPLVLKQLSQPRFDVFEASELIREKLYRAMSAEARKDLFDDYIAKSGEAGREGVLDQLFQDLRIQEADEQKRLSPRLKEKYAARECLVELYGYTKGVKSDDRPEVEPLSNTTLARFIDTLVSFPSKRLDEAVRQVLQSCDDYYLARSCVFYLIGRGADADISRYVEERVEGADEKKRLLLARLLDRLGWTPLHAAAERYEPGRVETLIHQGAEVNARAANGQTPLHVAAEHGSFGAIRVLLEHDADPNLKDEKGLTPVQLGIGYDAGVKMLLDAGAEPSDILVAAFAGRADVIEGYLQNDKGLVDVTKADGETPLHLAVGRGHVEATKILLDNGADVNARDQSQFTPLHRAAMFGKRETVALLLGHGADRNAKSWDGKTPLTYAREQRDRETIRLLEAKPK